MKTDRLRQLRIERGLTQVELAQAIHVGEKEIWRYENNKTSPSADTLAKIAEVLDVSTDYLLGLSDAPQPFGSSDLSPNEQALIAAWRKGDYRRAIEALAAR